MRIKPTQMALVTLGYEHDMVVTDQDVQLRVELPGVDVVFRIDPVTYCLEAVFTWHGRLSPEMAGDALHYLVQINRGTFEPQFALKYEIALNIYEKQERQLEFSCPG